LEAFTDATDLVAWTTQLQDGKPLPGVKASITHTGASATSDGKGLATRPLERKGEVKGAHQMVLAQKGGDTAFVPRNTYFWSDSSSFTASDPSDRLQWFVFDDRGMYKPGEKVRVSGWMRTYEA